MSEEREQQVGGTTDPASGDDAAKQAALAGAAAEAGSETVAEDEKGERQDWKKKYLTEVTPALEEKNRLKREAEELRERLSSVEQQKPPTADTQAQADAARLEHIRRRMIAAQAQADAGDATAELTLMNLQETYRLQQERITERAEMQREREDERYTLRARVVDEDTGDSRPLSDDEVEELDRFYQRNRAQFQSKQAAHDALLGRKYRERASSLAKARKLASAETERRETKDVIRTTHREVGAAETKAREFASEEAYDKELESLRQQGREGEAFALIAARRAGKARVR